MRKYTKRGFTLIELLVVIAVIGILSSIVLVSLAGARDKARDAKIQSDVGQIRPLAEMINDTDSAYTLLEDPAVDGTLNLGHATYGGQLGVLESDIAVQGGAVVCQASGQNYCVYSVLNVGTRWYCADATGQAGTFTVDPAGTCGAGTPVTYTCAP